MVREFRTSDEGKTVVTSDGDEVGTVQKIEGDMAHVKPNDSIGQSVRRRLGWAEEDKDVYEIDHSSVERISDDELHLQE